MSQLVQNDHKTVIFGKLWHKKEIVQKQNKQSAFHTNFSRLYSDDLYNFLVFFIMCSFLEKKSTLFGDINVYVKM